MRTKVSKKQANAVLAKVPEQFAPYRKPTHSEPTLILDWI